MLRFHLIAQSMLWDWYLGNKSGYDIVPLRTSITGNIAKNGQLLRQ